MENNSRIIKASSYLENALSYINREKISEFDIKQCRTCIKNALTLIKNSKQDLRLNEIEKRINLIEKVLTKNNTQRRSY
jgi:hypothetical protein